MKNKQWLIINEQKKLEKMQNQATFSLRILQWCSHEFLLPANLPKPPSGLTKIFLEAKLNLAANSKKAQRLQADKISLLQKEIELIELRIASMEISEFD